MGLSGPLDWKLKDLCVIKYPKTNSELIWRLFPSLTKLCWLGKWIISVVKRCFSEASAISVTLCTANLINVAFLISNRRRHADTTFLRDGDNEGVAALRPLTKLQDLRISCLTG